MTTTKILIQARSTSTRFPGKIFETIGNFSVLEHVYYKAAGICDSVVIIPLNDEVTHRFCIEKRLPYFEGSMDDLLQRHYHAALAFGCDNIVRITSDCPLFSPATVKFLVEQHELGNCDLTTNYPSCADGHDVDIFSIRFLKYLHDTSAQREHPASEVKNNVKKYKTSWNILVYQEPYDKDWFPKISIDEPKDLETVRAVYHKQFKEWKK